jgi:hypothetical protein
VKKPSKKHTDFGIFYLSLFTKVCISSLTVCKSKAKTSSSLSLQCCPAISIISRVSAGSSHTASHSSRMAVGSSRMASHSSRMAVGSSRTASHSSHMAVGSSRMASHSSRMAVGSSHTASHSSRMAVGSSRTANSLNAMPYTPNKTKYCSNFKNINMPNSRVPQKESDFAAYLYTTTQYLTANFRNPINTTVGADESINLINEQNLPENLEITLTNTGAVGVDPPLYFCMANADDDTCDPLTAITVNAGSSATVTVKQLGGPGKYYLNVTNTHATDSSTCLVTFQANWERLGLLESVKQKWENDSSLWAHKYLLTQSEITRTPALVEEKNLLKDAFTPFAQGVLKTIEGSVNIVNEDYGIFNIAKRDDTNTPREPITTAPITILYALAAGMVKVENRAIHDSTRPSMLPNADAIELRWIIQDIAAAPPASWASITNVNVISKATYTMMIDPINAGKRLYVVCRWLNNAEPNKSGPWGTIQSVVITA